MDGIKELLILTELLQVAVLSRLSHFQLFATPWTVAHQAPLSIGFPRQEYWSGLLFASPGDLPDPRIKPISLVSPALQAGSLPLAPPRKLSGYKWGGFTEEEGRGRFKTEYQDLDKVSTVETSATRQGKIALEIKKAFQLVCCLFISKLMSLSYK